VAIGGARRRQHKQREGGGGIIMPASVMAKNSSCSGVVKMTIAAYHMKMAYVASK